MNLAVRRFAIRFLFSVALVIVAMAGTSCAPKFNFQAALSSLNSTTRSACPATATLHNAVGSGTAGDPYQICTAAQMTDLAALSSSSDWGADYQLESDINMSGVATSPIGNGTTGFSGVFDGNGHTISNFSLTDNSDLYVGLFGYISGNGSTTGILKNLTLANASVTGSASNAAVGVLVGGDANGSISNCAATGSATQSAGGGTAGGLVGEVGFQGTAITNSSTNVTVAGTFAAGGLVGNDSSTSSTFSDCIALGSVISSSNGALLGGLIGQLSGTLVDSYARGNVKGTGSPNTYVGGLVGDSAGVLENSYATGSVTGSGKSFTYTGGLVGYAAGGTLIRSYSTGAVTGSGGSSGLGGLVGADSGFLSFTGKSYWNNTVNSSLSGIGNTSNSNVMGASTNGMLAPGTYSGWDFVSTWEMPTGGVNQGYPVLQWSGNQ